MLNTLLQMGITLLVTLDKRTKISNMLLNMTLLGNSLAVLWLGLSAFTVKDLSLIANHGTRIPLNTAWPKANKNYTANKRQDPTANSGDPLTPILRPGWVSCPQASQCPGLLSVTAPATLTRWPTSSSNSDNLQTWTMAHSPGDPYSLPVPWEFLDCGHTDQHLLNGCQSSLLSAEWLINWDNLVRFKVQHPGRGIKLRHGWLALADSAKTPSSTHSLHPHHLLSPGEQTARLGSTSRTVHAQNPRGSRSAKGKSKRKRNQWGDNRYWRAAPHPRRPARNTGGLHFSQTDLSQRTGKIFSHHSSIRNSHHPDCSWAHSRSQDDRDAKSEKAAHCRPYSLTLPGGPPHQRRPSTGRLLY